MKAIWSAPPNTGGPTGASVSVGDGDGLATASTVGDAAGSAAGAVAVDCTSAPEVGLGAGSVLDAGKRAWVAINPPTSSRMPITPATIQPVFFFGFCPRADAPAFLRFCLVRGEAIFVRDKSVLLDDSCPPSSSAMKLSSSASSFAV